MTHWRSIETAPRDGTEVLVTNGEHVWISSRLVIPYCTKGGREFGPMDGHDWCMRGQRKPPTGWRRKPGPET